MIESQRQKYGQRLGLNPTTTDPYEQVEMFRAYVKDRYSTANNALAFHLSNNWY